jgi:hypothetical protein
MMRRLHVTFPLIVLSGFLAGAGAATAAPSPASSLGELSSPIEQADWVPRCWWRQTYWGPQQVCRQVWVDSYSPGYGFYGGYGWRRHHHHHRDWDDNWR